MKKQIYFILVVLAVLFVSFPAFAGDWYATLEREILVNNSGEQAIENAVKSGVDRDTAFIAVFKILDQDVGNGCGGCNSSPNKCCDASPYTTGSPCESACPAALYNSCCK